MDTFSNVLSSIKNAQTSFKMTVYLKYSRLCWNFLKILLIEGYINGFMIENQKIKVYLRYKNNKPSIQNLKRISKPGKRIFSSLENLRKFKKGLGTLILSTPQGLLCDRDARSLKVGGEILCRIF